MIEKKYIKKIIEESKTGYKYENLKKTLTKSREELLLEIEKSNLRGRGGAGFPTALKWGFVKDKEDVILICNGDEGEPGTFKDRYILEEGVSVFLEGALISAYILNANEIYIYIRGEYKKAISNLKEEISNIKEILNLIEKKAKNKVEIKIIKGAGAYVCGDETSLINSIEGKRPISRIKPPYPAQKGLNGKPTIVNNIETLTNIPLIIRDGGDNYSKLGIKKSSGTKLICISGKVNNPGVYEVEFGSGTIREIIEDLSGGIKDGKSLKFIIPGGVSTPILLPNEINISFDYESIKNAGSALGSGALIVADDTISVLDVAKNSSDFYKHETCGTCFPCKEGNRQVDFLLQKIINGTGKEKHLDMISEISETTKLCARCGLGQTAGDLVVSTISKFREEYLRNIKADN